MSLPFRIPVSEMMAFAVRRPEADLFAPALVERVEDQNETRN
jgi:hypothetical protein